MEYNSKDNFILIDNSIYSSLTMEKKNRIIRLIKKGIKENKIGYPYKYYNLQNNLDINEIKKIVKNLNPNVDLSIKSKNKSGKCDYPNYNGTVVYIWNSYYKNNGLDSLTDYFSEKNRMMCETANNSPQNYFESVEWFNEMVKLKITINKENVREYIYNRVKQCTLYPVYTVMAVLKFFEVKRYFDASMGWGDRLIGALLSSTIKEYVGTDPNPRMSVVYKNINNFFNSSNLVKTTFYKEPFEKLMVDENFMSKYKNHFDIIFTSPPFFDKEIYIKNVEQSYIKYNNENEWLNKFLWFSFNKSIDIIKINGHVALYLGNIEKENYISLFIKKMNDNKKIKFMGSIWASRKSGDIRPIYIWKKLL